MISFDEVEPAMHRPTFFNFRKISGINLISLRQLLISQLKAHELYASR